MKLEKGGPSKLDTAINGAILFTGPPIAIRFGRGEITLSVLRCRRAKTPIRIKRKAVGSTSATLTYMRLSLEGASDLRTLLANAIELSDRSLAEENVGRVSVRALPWDRYDVVVHRKKSDRPVSIKHAFALPFGWVSLDFEREQVQLLMDSIDTALGYTK